MPVPHHARVTATPWPGVYATQIESGRSFRKHWHATFGIGWLAQGAQVSASGRGRVEAFAGDLITTNPGEVHDGQPLGGASRRWQMLYFDTAAFASAACDPTRKTNAGLLALHQPVVRDARLSLAFRQVLARLEGWSTSVDRGGPHVTDDTDDAATATGRHTAVHAAAHAAAQRLACDEALVTACTLLSAGQPSVREDPRRPASAAVAQVRSLLADDPLHPPSLAALAAMTGLSRYQLIRHFDGAYGITPHAWLLQRRTELARERIRHGDALADAATAAGFADQSHMTRLFTRQFGFTPGAWQQAMAPKAALRAPLHQGRPVRLLRHNPTQ
jgi:AraC-like DNA-binding protein